MYSWIVFDAMGVIFEDGDDTNDLLVPYVQNINENIGSELINKYYLKASLGKISSDEFWRKIGIEEDSEYQNIEKSYLDNFLKLDKSFVNVVLSLRKKYKIGLISNDVSEWSKYLRMKYNLNELFDEIVISGDVGVRKPDKKIFELFLHSANVRADECIFIDDRDRNLSAAMELGMKGIRFRREQEYAGQLDVKEITDFNNLEEAIHLLDC